MCGQQQQQQQGRVRAEQQQQQDEGVIKQPHNARLQREAHGCGLGLVRGSGCSGNGVVRATASTSAGSASCQQEASSHPVLGGGFVGCGGNDGGGGGISGKQAKLKIDGSLLRAAGKML